MIKFFNTLSRKIEEFIPIIPARASYYSCGPTVYDFAHIGHARTYIFADILEKALVFNGYEVKRVMNITDVGHLTSDSDTGEDKMEKGAKREKKSVWQIAEFYTGDFFENLKFLNIKKPGLITKATDYIPGMINLVAKLEKKGFTYKTDDGIYFDTSKLPDYGKLTGKKFEELAGSLKAGARVEKIPGKLNITDFALWKLSPPGEKRQMEWDSPWGKGFPGWHIECSAMAMEMLGETIDIHTGGVDHIQIHHTNEIAQSEAATGKKFVRYWLHAGHLTIEGEKMSKSLGNFFRVHDLMQKGYDPLSLRYLFLTASYRKDMNFTFKSMDGAQSAYTELKNKIAGIKEAAGRGERTSLSEEKTGKIDALRNEFIAGINNDLNVAEGLSVLWKTIKSNIPSGDKLDLIYLFDEILGLNLRDIKEAGTALIPEKIRVLADKRENARKDRNFKEADRIRKAIENEGFILEDTPGGPQVKAKS